MGELSLLASVRADVCRLWKCPVPSEQQEREGHRHLGAETGQGWPPGTVLLCAAQEVGPLLTRAWPRPAGPGG